MRVLALDTSSPVSTIVVHTSTSVSLRQKESMTASSWCSFICPWAVATRASGTSSARRAAVASMSSTRLWTKNTCPSRSSSRRIAAETCLVS